MPSIDPKTYQPRDDDNISKADSISKADFLAAMQQLIVAIKTTDDPTAKERAVLEAERLALEQERVKREMPENKQAPGIGVFFTAADKAKYGEKPTLTCPFNWCGQDETEETLTVEEIVLRNRLVEVVQTSGAIDGLVTKSNGDRVRFTATPKRTDSGKVERMTVHYKCKDEHKNDHMPNTAYLRQVLGEAIPSTADLMAELAKLRAELETAKAGAARV